jgi:hypothetical protein
MTEAAIEIARRKSSAATGNGTSMTKTTLMAARGSRTSRNRSQMACFETGRMVSVVVLIV